MCGSLKEKNEYMKYKVIKPEAYFNVKAVRIPNNSMGFIMGHP